MHKTLVAVAGLLMFSVAMAQDAGNTPADKAPASKAHVLKAPELDKLLASPEHVLIIDVRRPDEVSAKGGFPVYLSIQASALEQSLAYIPKDRQIVTVSNHAARAGKAADFLAAHGFKVAGAAGTETYEQEGGHAVVHIAIPPPAPTAAH